MIESADDTIDDAKIEKWKIDIYELERDLDREGKRISYEGERQLSDKYTETNTQLKQAKADYEQNVGRPYTPPDPKPSQFDSTLFIRPRTRTASSESKNDEAKDSAASSINSNVI
ncbi:MAG: hypothetical protein P1U36_00300 [Legionellaceae bacterium]|nr:hypothetical protein [Legionellaceae bacterium]